MRSKLGVAGLTALIACTNAKRETAGPALFQLLGSTQTGINFANTIVTSDSLNFQRDAYVYNGAGVGVGDINNDGLPDIYFAGNAVSSRLYLNKGGMRFQDITKQAGVGTDRWATGVAMVDINNDGYIDIYVSVSGPPWTPASKRANLLFINNGNGTFTEAAAKYGIADTGFATQAAFFDYNGDNCLDLFLLNGSAEGFSRSDFSPAASNGSRAVIGSRNELYRNNCNGTFTNVSEEAGIAHDTGFGLGVAIADLNQDGWPDIYVSNDVAPNDVVYMNNGDGTFTNKRASWFRHTSYSGMGVDVADFNNDGWPDVLQVDMLPRDLAQRKKTIGSTTFAALAAARRQGLLDDFTANALQLNVGRTSKRDVAFSDIAHMAGVAATDWSWSPLFADLDNDGEKDILITNGYPKAVNDRDYVLPPIGANAFNKSAPLNPLTMLNNLYAYHLPNYVFRNRGDLTFEDVTTAWGMEQPSFSYGAAYADLDNDGKLDVVVNNMNAPAFVYRNVGRAEKAHHYLRVKLVGDPPNRDGIGAQLVLTVGSKRQYLYQSPYRGYMSSVDMRPHFGLGDATRVDSLEIEWPDGRRQILLNLVVDREITIRQSEATIGRRMPIVAVSEGRREFVPIALPGLKYTQPATSPRDYSVQPLLPYVLSKHGPVLAVGDVNGDGLDDLFVGGSNGIAGKLFIQRPNGAFVESRGQPWEVDKSYEDWGAVFFDANGDEKPDLYVASGGYQLAPASPLLQDRLYINQGGGRFARTVNALPPMLASKSVVRVGDFNGDGRPDLFIGGRVATRSYPYPTRSFVLLNTGGAFRDVTMEVAPDLIQPGGMVTDATWVDFDGDGRLDLVTVGEWMSINFYRNEGNRFRNVTASTGLPSMRGWWFSVAAGDFDRDGRPDLVAGNLGLNYTYTTSHDSAFGVYAGDFTGNRTVDVMLTKSVNGKEYPFEGLAPLGWQIYPLAIRFPTYGSFADVPITAVLSENQRKQAIHYTADTFASQYLHNDGGGKFSARPLPNLAQVSPLKGLLVADVDGDGNLDLLAVGNLYDTEPNTPRADAGTGLWLRGDGKGQFLPVSPAESGFLTPREASGVAILRAARGKIVVVPNSADSLQFFRIVTK